MNPFNRRNLPLSVCIKESLKFGSRLLQRNGYSYNFFTNEIKENKITFNNFKFKEQFRIALKGTCDITFYRELHFKSIVYNKNSVLFIKTDENNIELYKVVIIFFSSSYKLFAYKLKIIKFDDHFQCYIVSPDIHTFHIINFNELMFFPKSIHKLATGELAVTPPDKT